MQDTGGSTHATGMHRHGADLLFDRRRLPGVARVQEEGMTGTVVLAAAVPLLTLPSLPMADHSGPLAVGTRQDVENHDHTRSCWGGLG